VVSDKKRPGNPAWVKGHSQCVTGRRLGAGGKLTPKHVANALWEFANWMADHFQFTLDKDSPYPEAVQLLLFFAKAEKLAPALRIAAATAASKHEVQYAHTPVEIPEFADIAHAESFQLDIVRREHTRQIDSKTAANIIARVQTWIHNKRADDELTIKRLNLPDTGPVSIRVEGGLPVLPGTENLIMPHQRTGQLLEGRVLNGHVVDVSVIEHQPQAPDSPPADQEPGP